MVFRGISVKAKIFRFVLVHKIIFLKSFNFLMNIQNVSLLEQTMSHRGKYSRFIPPLEELVLFLWVKILSCVKLFVHLENIASLENLLPHQRKCWIGIYKTRI